MDKKILVLVLTILSVGTILVQPASGVEPFEIVVAYPAGGPTDIMARLIADVGEKYLGQPMIVTNKTGSAGSIAAVDVLSSKPGSKAFTISQFYFALTVKTQKLPFNPDDFVPLHAFMRYKSGLFVRGDSPWKTLGELLDYAKKNPGKLTYVHSGRGSVTHLAMVKIFRKAGVEVIDVPYKGSADTLIALLGGHVNLGVFGYSAAKDHLAVGKLRGLAFLTDKRYSDLPDVPTVVELGFPEAAVFAATVGLYVHKDTPEDYKQALIDAFKKTCANPKFKKEIEKLGVQHRCWGPETMKEAIKKGEAFGIPIIKELGLYVEK